MTDDLMKRLDTLVEDLGEGRRCWPHEYISAAVDAMERIEALEAKLAKAVDLLRRADQQIVWESLGLGNTFAEEVEATLAELTGGKDE